MRRPSAIRSDNAHKKTPLAGEVGNLIFQLPGTVRGPRRLLMAHMDTVPICVGAKPVRKGDVVRSADPKTGLGADDRAGVAVVLNTALEILRRKLPHPPLTFFWPIQEEVGLHGARYVQSSLLGKPQAGVQLGRRRGRESHRSAPPADIGCKSRSRDWPPRRRGAGTGHQRHRHRLAGHRRSGPRGLARADRQRTASAARATSGSSTAAKPRTSSPIASSSRPKPAATTGTFASRSSPRSSRRSRTRPSRFATPPVRCGQVRFDGRLDYEAFQLADDEPAVAGRRSRPFATRDSSRSWRISNGGLDANWMTRSRHSHRHAGLRPDADPHHE